MKILESIPAYWEKHHELWGDTAGGDPVAYFCSDGAMICANCAEARCWCGNFPDSAELVERDDSAPGFCDDCGDTISLRQRG